MIISFPRARKMGRAPVDTERKTHYTLSITLNEVKQIQRRNKRRQRLALLSSETYLRAIHERCPQNSDIFHSPPSGGLRIKQNRQLPKGPITIAIRARFEYDSTTIRLQHATTRSEVFRALAYEIVYENQW